MNYCFQRRYLERIRIGNKSEKQKKTLVNSNKLFNGRNDAIKFAENPHKLLLNLTDKIDLKVAPTTFGPIKVFKKQSVINISCSFQNFYYTKLAFCHSQ